MEKVKQVWEYPTIAEVVYELVGKKVEEEKRHLLIGAGIVLGSKEAYDKEENLGGYKANISLRLAEEAGMIAEKIKELAGSKVLPKSLEELVEGTKIKGDAKGRIYRYVRGRKLYTEEKLKEMGRWVENLFCDLTEGREFKELREEFRNFEKKFKDFQKELKRLIKEGELTKEQIYDSEYPQKLVKLGEEKPGDYEKIRKRYNALSEYQKKVGSWLEGENKGIEEYFDDHS